jgi:hypothetical protein
VTKAKVCASIHDGRSFLESSSGIATVDSSSCGKNAMDSKCRGESTELAELRYNKLLYGEKL